MFQKVEKGDSVVGIHRAGEKRLCEESSEVIEHYNPDDCVCKKDPNAASMFGSPNEPIDGTQFRCDCLCSYDKKNECTVATVEIVQSTNIVKNGRRNTFIIQKIADYEGFQDEEADYF